jgi:hypothetical protein
MTGLMVRAGDPDLNAWTEATRLNPASGAANHLDDPRVLESFATLGANFGAAVANLARLAEAAPAAVA